MGQDQSTPDAPSTQVVYGRGTTVPPAPTQAAVDQMAKVRNPASMRAKTMELILDGYSDPKVRFMIDATTRTKLTVHWFAHEVPGATLAETKVESSTVLASASVKESGIEQLVEQPFPPTSMSIDGAVRKQKTDPNFYPLIITLESLGGDHCQTTFCRLTPSGSGHAMKVAKQIVRLGDKAFTLRTVYKSQDSAADKVECVICYSDLADTVVLPCGHLCLCSECAQRIRMTNKKCPICRSDATSLVQFDRS